MLHRIVGIEGSLVTKRYTATTTTNNLTPILSETVMCGCACHYEMWVMCIEEGGGECGKFEREAFVSCQDHTAFIVGDMFVTAPDIKTNDGLDVIVETQGHHLVVSVKGLAGITLNWRAVVINV